MYGIWDSFALLDNYIDVLLIDRLQIFRRAQTYSKVWIRPSVYQRRTD